MVNLKLKDVVPENMSRISAELSSAGRNAYEQLHTAIQSAYIVYEALFQKLLEAV